MTFEEWAEDYGLRHEPNHSPGTEADCRAAFLAGQGSERDALAIPACCGGSTFGPWGDREDGCTLRLHFTSTAEAEAWLERQRAAIRNRKEQG